MQTLPKELLFEICVLSGSTVLLTTSTKFNALLTAGKILDFMVEFGYDVHVCGKRSLNRRLRWTRYGHKHRVGGPAIEWANGDKEWFSNGKLHRENGPAVERTVEALHGYKMWYQNDKLHRTDGPAVEWSNGDKSWYQNNKLHRTNGPAIERHDGSKLWFVNGIFCREEKIGVED